MNAYWGIDPGKTGAIALVTSDGSASVWDMPLLGEHHIDTMEVLDLLRAFTGGTSYLILEKAQSMKGQGRVSIANYLTGYGMLLACAYISGVKFDEVHPATWKSKIGLKASKTMTVTQKKAMSIQRATQLFPDVDLHLAKHHGRAEALLLAEYGRRFVF